MEKYSPVRTVALAWLLSLSSTNFAAVPGVELRWAKDADVHDDILSAPVISTAGIVYAGAGTNVCAFDLSTGTEKRCCELPVGQHNAKIQASPALSADETTVYVTANFPPTRLASSSPIVTALTVKPAAKNHCQFVWTQSLNKYGDYLVAGAAVDPRSNIIWLETLAYPSLFMSTAKLFYQLEPLHGAPKTFVMFIDGVTAQVTPSEGSYVSGSLSAFAQSVPIIDNAGNMIAISSSIFDYNYVEKMRLFNKSDIQITALWEFFSWFSRPLSTPISSAAAELINDLVYVGGKDGNLYIYNTLENNNGPEYILPLGSDLSQGSPVVSNNVLYITGGNNYLHAVHYENAKATLKWVQLIDEASIFTYRPAVDSQHNVIYLVDQLGRLFAIKDKGDTATVLWRVNASANTAPVVVADPDRSGNMIVIVGTDHGTLRAFVGAI